MGGGGGEGGGVESYVFGLHPFVKKISYAMSRLFHVSSQFLPPWIFVLLFFFLSLLPRGLTENALKMVFQ